MADISPLLQWFQESDLKSSKALAEFLGLPQSTVRYLLKGRKPSQKNERIILEKTGIKWS